MSVRAARPPKVGNLDSRDLKPEEEFIDPSFDRVHIATAAAYLPQLIGGAQVATHDLVHVLTDSGQQISVSAELSKNGWLGARGRLALKTCHTAARDTALGYPVYRAWNSESAALAAVADLRPNWAIVQSMAAVPLAAALERCGLPVVFCFHNVEDHLLGGNPASLRAEFIANSQFTAEHVRDSFGLDATVIPPVSFSENYVTKRDRADSVLFVNPRPEKGLEKAVALARLCPTIPFIFAEAWSRDRMSRKCLEESLRPLKNVRLVRSRAEMRGLYCRTRVLIAPSQWQEAWGRVASEAQMSGIPVIASRVGGLGEAVGPGGILLDQTASAGEWAGHLRRLWSDTSLYSALSQAAREHAARPELSRSWQLARYLEAAARAMALRAE